jgi:hypothetical protein
LLATPEPVHSVSGNNNTSASMDQALAAVEMNWSLLCGNPVSK